MRAQIFALFVIGCLASLSSIHTSARQGQVSPTPAGAPSLRAVLDSYCIGCHNERLRTQRSLDRRSGPCSSAR